MNTVTRKELLDYTGQILAVERYRDYCPNGLQVEGKTDIGHIVSGVTASLALLDAAVEARADIVLVHHGYFWRNEDSRVIGIKKNRLKLLLQHDLNLAAYHLPLDAHETLGNNARLGEVCGWQRESWAGEQNLIALGSVLQPCTLAELQQSVSQRLQRPALLLGDPEKIVRRIAWCTGGAQGYMEQAIALGVDAFVSGEVSEQTAHLARESGVGYLAAGHHATERYGIQALGDHLASKFSLKHTFIDINNPV